MVYSIVAESFVWIDLSLAEDVVDGCRHCNDALSRKPIFDEGGGDTDFDGVRLLRVLFSTDVRRHISFSRW